jgi:hypothetical protein
MPRNWFPRLASRIGARRNRNARRAAHNDRPRLSVLNLEDKIVPTGSGPVQLGAGTGAEFFRAVAANPQGGYVALYDSQGTGTTSSVYAQRLDDLGLPAGDPIKINPDSSDAHAADGIAVGPDGSFVAVWSGAGTGGDGHDVFFRRFASDDTALDAAAVEVASVTAGVQDSASISVDGDGNFAIAWTDHGRDTMYNRPQRFVRLFDFNGDAQTDDIAVETTDIGNPWSRGPVVSMSGIGTFVVAYQTTPSDLDASGTGGYIQQFAYAPDEDGIVQVTAVGDPIVPYTNGLGDQSVLVAANADGSFVAVFSTSGTGGADSDVYARWYGADNTAIGDPFAVATGSADQLATGVGLDALGNVTVSWRVGPRTGGPYDLYTRRLNSEGTPLTDPIRVTTESQPSDPRVVPDGGGEATADPTTSGTQLQPVVAANADGASVVVWIAPDADGYGIFGRRMSPDGAPVGAAFQINTTTGGDQLQPAVAVAGDGSFVVVWRSPDGWNDGVFARRFDAAGAALDATQFQVNTTTFGIQWDPAVGIAADNSFVVAWSDSYNARTVARLYAADGTATSGELMLNAPAAGGYGTMRLAVAPDGSFAAGWVVTDYTTFMNFVVRTFAADGTPTSDEAVVRSGFWLPCVDVKLGADGSILATWQTADYWGNGIFARVRNADGVWGDPILVPVQWVGDQMYQSSAALPGGGWMVAWENEFYTGGDFDVYGRTLAADGTPIGSQFSVNANSAGDQTSVSLASGGTGVRSAWLSDTGSGGTVVTRGFSTANGGLGSGGGVAVGADGSFVVPWTANASGSGTYEIEARHYDPITSSTTETDTLTDISTDQQVLVVSTATTFADHVLWEYVITNTGQQSLGQFAVGGLLGGVTDMSNSLGWATDSGDTGWTAGASDSTLDPGQQAYFTFTSPTTVTPQSTAAVAEGPDGYDSATATGTLLGPGPTASETATFAYTPTDGPVAGVEQDIEVTSSATVFGDHILWQYKVTNESFVGLYPASWTGVEGFEVDALFGPDWVVTNDFGWGDTASGGSGGGPGNYTVVWAENPNVGGMDMLPGQSANFTLTTALCLIGQVDAETGGGPFEIGGTQGKVLGAVPMDTIVASNDQYSASSSSAPGQQDQLSVPTSGVLANDYDEDNSDAVLSARVVDGPAYASQFTLNNDGSFTYTASQGFVGDDIFTYQAWSGGSYSSPATVTIHVVPDLIVANDDAYTIGHGQTLTVPAAGLLANDFDYDGNPITIGSESAVTPSNAGSLTVNNDGSFTFVASAGFSGQAQFTYTATDGDTTSAPATVTIDVTDAPPLANKDYYSTHRNQTLTVAAGTGVLLNDSDPDGDPITATVATNIPAGTGNLTLQPDGSFAFVPAQDFSGTVSFTYVANDGMADSEPATVTITVVGDAPVAVDDDFYTAKNQVLTVAADGVLTNDTASSGSLTASLISNPTHGTLAYFSSDGSFEYTPDSCYAGDDSFVYEVTDGTGLTSDATVTVSVVGLSLVMKGLDPSQNTTTGGYVGINANSDNNPAAVVNFIPRVRDFNVTKPTAKADADLVEVYIDLSDNAQPIPGVFTLSITNSGSGRIKLWSDAKKTSLILDASTGSAQRAYDYSSLPRDVYIEGTNPSSATKDLTITLSWFYIPIPPPMQFPFPVTESTSLSAAVTPIVNSFTVTAPAGNPGDIGGVQLVAPGAQAGTDGPWMGVRGAAAFNAEVNLNSNTGKIGDARFIQNVIGIDNGQLNNSGAGLVYANGQMANEKPINAANTRYSFPLLDMPQAKQPSPYPYYDSGGLLHDYSETPGGSNVWTLKDGDGPATFYQYRNRKAGYPLNSQPFPMVPATLPAAANLTSVDLSYRFRLYLVVELPAASGSAKKVIYTLGYIDWTVNFLATKNGGVLTMLANGAGGGPGTGVFPGTFQPKHDDPDPKGLKAPTGNVAVYVR